MACATGAGGQRRRKPGTNAVQRLAPPSALGVRCLQGSGGHGRDRPCFFHNLGEATGTAICVGFVARFVVGDSSHLIASGSLQHV